MNKRIVILLLAALILAFTTQVNAVFVVLSPVPDPSPTPTVRFATPMPIIEVTQMPIIKVTRILDELGDATPEPVSDRSKLETLRRFEFRLGTMDWDAIWEVIEAWLETR